MTKILQFALSKCHSALAVIFQRGYPRSLAAGDFSRPASTVGVKLTAAAAVFPQLAAHQVTA
jgi:hypothetical protein